MKLNIQMFADGEVIIPVNLDTKSFDAQIAKVEYDLDELEESYKLALKDPDFDPKELRDMQDEIERTKNKLIGLQQKRDELGKDNGGKGFKGISSAMEGLISKVTRWGLAVIGVRSAYSGIRSAMSLVLAHNKKLAGQMDVMKTALANALLPIVKTIVQFIAKIMQMIDYVYFRLTGKHLFDFSKAFKDANKNAKGTAKATKDIRKNLAGFDEMNILNDNTASAGGGAGGGAGFDNPFEGWEKFKVPEWLDKIVNILKWCKDNLPLVAGAVTMIFGAIKIAKIMSLVSKLGTGGLLGVLVALDAILVGTIIVTIKKKLLPLIKETNEQIEKSIEMTQGRKNSTEKLTKATLENAKSEKENTEATARNIDYMLKSIDSRKKENKELLDQTSLTGMLTGENKLHRETIKANNEETVAYLETLGELYDLQKLTPQQVETYSQALAEEIHRLEIANRNLGENTQEYKDNADKINTLKNNLNKLPDTVTSKIKIDANTKPARDKIVDLLSDIGKSGIEGALNLKTSVNSAINIIKNRKGGIINLPSRGVPLNIGGEAGPEGIVPLTDSQQMALLGEAIGRYITINAQITNTMNGRVISRELQKIQQENSFASNR